MFFKNYLIYIFLKFLWVGLVLGLIRLVFNFINKLSRDNVFVYNLTSFIYWLFFGGCYIALCFIYYNYSFCWFGLLAMILGLFLVRVSLDFLLTNLLVILYYKFTNFKIRKKQINELQTEKKN